MERSGLPLHVVCALALMEKSDVPPSHAHDCYVDKGKGNLSQKEAAAQSVWVLGVSMNFRSFLPLWFT